MEFLDNVIVMSLQFYDTHYKMEEATELDDPGKNGCPTSKELQLYAGAKIADCKRAIHECLTRVTVPRGRLEIPLCRMRNMQVVREALDSDVEKLVGDFCNGYVAGEAAFYVSLKDDNGYEHPVGEELRNSWGPIWNAVNDDFDKELAKNDFSSQWVGKMFYVWDGNHKTLTWMKCINDMHPDKKSWHYWVSLLLLDVPENNRSLVKAAMANINEYVIYIPDKLCFNDIAVIF